MIHRPEEPSETGILRHFLRTEWLACIVDDLGDDAGRTAVLARNRVHPSDSHERDLQTTRDHWRPAMISPRWLEEVRRHDKGGRQPWPPPASKVPRKAATSCRHYPMMNPPLKTSGSLSKSGTDGSSSENSNVASRNSELNPTPTPAKKPLSDSETSPTLAARR